MSIANGDFKRRRWDGHSFNCHGTGRLQVGESWPSVEYIGEWICMDGILAFLWCRITAWYDVKTFEVVIKIMFSLTCGTRQKLW